MMEDSILITIKKLLGISADYTAFDVDVIVAINSALMALYQIGVGNASKHMITGYDDSWSLILNDSIDLESAKEYVYIKTRLIFDPPTSSSMVDAMNSMASEIEWRLNVQNDDWKVFKDA